MQLQPIEVKYLHNPIYILHLTDWHLKEKYPDKNDELLNKLENVLSDFLSQRGREWFNIISITGDMTNSNGSSTTRHKITSDAVNKLKNKLYDSNSTKLYCTPGNHDSDRLTIYQFNNRKENKEILSNLEMPNYNIVDNNYEELSKAFNGYVEFAKDIGADNKENPFRGFDTLEYGRSRVFISWFNSSWLCTSLGWQGISQKNLHDSQNLSVGYNINQQIIEEFKSFKKKVSRDKQFCLSMFHHHPRFLSWHDKYDIDKKSKKHKSIYRHHFSKYDLILNGHTHGRLFDFPYHTSTGGLTSESNFSNNYVTIFEVDLYRNVYTRHNLPISAKENGTRDKKLLIYNHETYEKLIKSNYNLKDLYHDLDYNGKLHKEINSEYLSGKKAIDSQLIKDIGVNPQIGMVLDGYDCKIEEEPFLYENIEKEINALNYKLSSI